MNKELEELKQWNYNSSDYNGPN